MSDMDLIFCACVYKIKLTDLAVNQNFSTIMIWMLLESLWYAWSAFRGNVWTFDSIYWVGNGSYS